MKKQKLITIQQYAEMCDVSRATVYNWITEKLITPIKTSAGWAIDINSTSKHSVRRGGRPTVQAIIG